MIDLTFNIDNNDCELIYDDDNMIASSIRRLNTTLDTTLYDEYGSNIHGLLGLRKSEVNLEFLNQSISQCILQDERITECNVESMYTVDGFKTDITIVYEDNTVSFDYQVSMDEED